MPDTLLRKVPREDMPEEIGYAFDRALALRGDGTLLEVFANHPELYSWYSDDFYGEVFRGGLVERRIKELARLRLAVTHGSRTCRQTNRQEALAAGLTRKDIDAVVDFEASTLKADEKAVLRLADQMALTKPDGRLTRELYEDLKQYFNDAEILELGLVLGVLAGIAKFLFAFELVEKEPDGPIAQPDA